MLVCGPEGVAPPLGPDFERVPRKLSTVDTVHRTSVIHANAVDAAKSLLIPASVEMAMAAASQKISHRMFTTSSTNLTVGFSSILMM